MKPVFLTLLLFYGLTSLGQSATRSLPSINQRVILCQIFDAPIETPIEQGSIVTKNGDTLSGYINMNKFHPSESLRQVSYLPSGKEKHSDLRMAQLDSIDYIVIRSGSLFPAATEIRYTPIDGEIWTLLGMDQNVRICRKNPHISYNFEGGQEVEPVPTILISNTTRITIPFTSVTLRADRYFFGKFIQQRYGEKFSRQQLRHKDPIKIILDKENQRLSTHVAKSS
jgi:hypothetical protein